MQKTGRSVCAYQLSGFGQTISLPAAKAPEQAEVRTRHVQPELFGLPLPCSVQEVCRYEQQETALLRTEEQAAALARMQCLQALYAAWPDAELLARKEDCAVNGDVLDYTAVYTIVADIGA